MPWIEWSRAYCFALSVCLFVINFNIRYNFWTVRDGNFIFGMYTLLMTPFPMAQGKWPRHLDFHIEVKVLQEWTQFWNMSLDLIF